MAGKLRELEHALTRAVVLSSGSMLDAVHLSIACRAGTAGSDGGGAAAFSSLRELERRHIRSALEHKGWNKARTCALLDISGPTLDCKLEECELLLEEEGHR